MEWRCDAIPELTAEMTKKREQKRKSGKPIDDGLSALFFPSGSFKAVTIGNGSKYR